MTHDLMYSAEIKEVVREAYRAIERNGGAAAVAERLYGEELLSDVPRSAIERSVGVGNHLRYADIRPGQTILDVGCGGGIDTVLAARRTGPTGRVIALDFLPEMLARTADAAAEAGLDNVELLESEMEAIDLPDSSVDLIVSNGVINLSPRKARAMAECARVLRPGGALCVSDLTVEQDELPPEVATQPSVWAGCVAGALKEEDFIRQLERAGFEEIEIVERAPFSVDDCALYPLFGDQVLALMRKLIPADKQTEVGTSVTVRASRAGA